MRDPAESAYYSESWTKEMKDIFNRSRSKIYNEHDARLKEYITKEYKLKPGQIKIDDYRNRAKGVIP